MLIDDGAGKLFKRGSRDVWTWLDRNVTQNEPSGSKPQPHVDELRIDSLAEEIGNYH